MVKLSLWTLPDILIIHLKRFCQLGERRHKLSTLVKFPLSGLNMAPHVAQRSAGPPPATGPWPPWKQPAGLPPGYPLDFLYDLYAVCNHHGTLQGGHYTGEPCRGSWLPWARVGTVAWASRCSGKRCSWHAELPRALDVRRPPLVARQAPAREREGGCGGGGYPFCAL